MKKIIILFVIMLLAVSLVSAAILIPRSDKAKPSDNAPLTPPGLEKKVFIHYKEGFVSPFCVNDGVCDELDLKPNCADCKVADPVPDSTCYTFLANGVLWKDLPQDLFIHPDLDENAIIAGAEEWDAHTSTNLFGSYIPDSSATWDDDAPDGRNEMVFGDYPQDGVIAVAITWGYFTGPPGRRRIVEFDILFDIDFIWGDAEKDPTLMDLQNIATHEIGHGLGLGDLYNAECAEETMYGYSWEGDMQKRDLNPGDIAGIQALYGE